MKRITVDPGQRLSYQSHDRRAEHWFVVAGTALVTLDGADRELGGGRGHRHPPGRRPPGRATPAPTPLVFVEVQQGDYFGEDDIVRLDDDYGRPLTTRGLGGPHGPGGYRWTSTSARPQPSCASTLLAFMDEHVYPAEPVYGEQMAESGDPHHHPPVIEELKAEARAAGLWNLFLPHKTAVDRRACPTSTTRRWPRSWAAASSPPRP